MKCSSEMLQTLPYFWNTKTHVVFYDFSLLNALVYVDLDKGIQ